MEAAPTGNEASSGPGGLVAYLRSVLPRGNTLPPAIWLRRHRALLILLELLAAALTVFALASGFGVLHSFFEGGIVATFGVAGVLTMSRPRLASTLVSVGLMSASGVLVHMSGGMIEAHFLFFVLILLLTLYEDWVPFLLAAVFVLIHHGIAGTVDPASVYNHPDAIAHPWKWAGIHALFITAAGLAGVTTWRLNEDYRVETEEALSKAQASERSLAEAQELSRIGSFEWDLIEETVTWSDQLYRVFGADPERFRPNFNNYLTGIHPEDRERVRQALAAALGTGAPFGLQYRYVQTDGAVRSLHSRAEVIAEPDGRLTKLVGTCQDITEREQAQAQIVERAEGQAAVAELGEKALEGNELTTLFNEAVASVARVVAVDVVGVLECTTDGFAMRAAKGPGVDQLGSVPGGAHSQAGYTVIVNRPVIVHDWDQEDRFEKSPMLTLAQVRSGATVVIGGGEGTPFGVLGIQSLELREFDVNDIHFLQSVAHVLATAIERRRVEGKIRYEALHDRLTGLPNRNLFVDLVTNALKRSGRKEKKIAVLFLDLDQFKLVNDSLGHDAGDELLCAVAPRISGALRAGDTVARFGGDEFAVLINELEDEQDATRTAERIAAVFSQPIVLRGREHFVSATVGIAIHQGTGPNSPEALIRDADSAMYRAKDRGRGTYEIFDEVMRASVVEHLRIENDLRVALERGQLHLHYQPVVSLRSRMTVGVEALLRWEHPERGAMTPGQFIPFAEESGLIVPVGAWVLKEACRQAADWHAARPDQAPLKISVNLSARQIADPGLIKMIKRALEDTHLDPTSLRLEITETALVEEGEASLSTLNEMKALGIGLALDDFGTGFSSLSYLKRYPFDALKVDRSFVARLCEEPADAAIVKAVNGIADALGLEVVAEGVETEEQLEAVRGLGCDQAQGFYFARPMPNDQLLRLLGTDGRFDPVGAGI